MKTTAVYFSPTGNTKKSVDAMARALDADYQAVDLTVAQGEDGQEFSVQMQFSGEDFVIFGMPVYGGRLPALAAERLSGIRGEQTPCVLVVTYGNRHYDDALVELQDLCEAQGFVVKGAAALVGRHTYGEIQVGRPDEADLEADAAFVRKAVLGDGLHATIPGSRPWKRASSRRLPPMPVRAADSAGNAVRREPSDRIFRWTRIGAFPASVVSASVRQEPRTWTRRATGALRRCLRRSWRQGGRTNIFCRP